ncbi:MAG: RDD family protein [Cyclobacteriaceae bacterium]
MQRVSIETTQNVDIEYNLASIGDRIAATLIDWLVIFLYWLAMGIILAILGAADIFSPFNDDTSTIIIFAILTLPITFYYIVCEVALNGQTIGKRHMNIKVSRLDGRSPKFSQYLLRWIFWPIDVMFFYGIVGMLCIGLGEKGQRLGDMVGGTTVIKLNKKVDISNSALVQIAQQDEYVPTYPQADKLTDQEAALIEEVLSISTRTGDREPVLRLFAKVKNLLEIQTNDTPEVFLRTVTKDHAYYSAK